MENSIATKTQEDQWMVQDQVFRIYNLVFNLPPHAQSVNFEIRRDNHVEYLANGLKQLGPKFSVLDANRPWLCYWIIHSIALLSDCIDDKLENDVVDFLSRCQDPNGGFGGGPGQMPHLATTYAAVHTLITVGGPRSLSSINRKMLYAFFLRMKDRSGGFRMHDGGEVDVRACYTAISVASVLNIMDDRLTENVGDYILSCQTYEGGIAGEPGSEAHGGYTFCGLAAMVLINEVNRLDLPGLINWVVFRQGVECGFQGRTNKLVDGCYSFWQVNGNFKLLKFNRLLIVFYGYLDMACDQGGAAAIIQRLHLTVNEQLGLPSVFKNDCSADTDHGSPNSDLSVREQVFEGTSSPVNDICRLSREGKPKSSHSKDTNYNASNFVKEHIGMRPLFNSMALQQYIILCSQEEAGFRDKPGKPRDHYHTCYVLSGLSICQYSGVEDVDSPPLARDIMGPYSNLLEPIHPLHNIVLDKYYEAQEFVSKS